MEATLHPLAAHHVPFFITQPGETDGLLVAMGIVLVAAILGLGVLYFRLHALPEQMSHGKNNKTQFEIVAVLALLALFTHNNLFWVAALILAMVPIPDFTTPLYAMASELKRIAGGSRAAGAEPPKPVPVADLGPVLPDLPPAAGG
jgi:branched-subunit amino acid transport protein AzlD